MSALGLGCKLVARAHLPAGEAGKFDQFEGPALGLAIRLRFAVALKRSYLELKAGMRICPSELV
jgi:hypothetical protein